MRCIESCECTRDNKKIFSGETKSPIESMRCYAQAVALFDSVRIIVECTEEPERDGETEPEKYTCRLQITNNCFTFYYQQIVVFYYYHLHACHAPCGVDTSAAYVRQLSVATAEVALSLLFFYMSSIEHSALPHKTEIPSDSYC